jgi:hypothetical protein
MALLKVKCHVLNMCGPMKFYMIYKQANEGEERDIVILE